MKIVSNIKKLSGKAGSFFVISFITIFAVLVLRNSSLFLSTYLWAEDGPVFLEEGITNTWKSLLSPYAGYLHLIPRSCTLLAITISKLTGKGIQMAPQIMQLSALLIEAFCIAYICSERFSWLMEKRGRLLTAVALAACSSSQCIEIWFTVTNLQWWCGMLIFWICMDCIYRKELPDSLPVVVMLSYIGFSTPLGGITVLVFSGLLLHRLICWKKIDRVELLYFFIVMFPVIVQLILSVSQGRTQNSSIGRAAAYSLQTLFGTVPSVLYTQIFQNIYQSDFVFKRITVIALGMCLWFVLASIFLVHKRMIVLLYIFGYCEICLFLSFYTNGDAEMLFWAQAGGRYLALPQWAFLTTVCIALYDLLECRIWSVAGILIGTIVCTCGLHYSLNLPDAYAGIYSSASFLYQPGGKQVCEISIHPGWPWSVTIPMELGTLKEREIEDVTFGDFFVDGVAVSNGAEENILMEKDIVTFNGWVADEVYGADPAAVLIKCGHIYFAACLEDDADVDAVFGGEGKDLKSRYQVSIPVEMLETGDYQYEIVVILQSKTEYCRRKGRIGIFKAQE